MCNTIYKYNSKDLSFKAIKGIKYTGLYRQYPEFADDLIKTFKSNKIIADFYTKNDVRITLDAEFKNGLYAVENSLSVVYKSIHEKKTLKKFLENIFNGQPRYQFSIKNTCDSEADNIKSIKKCTQILKDKIEQAKDLTGLCLP